MTMSYKRTTLPLSKPISQSLLMDTTNINTPSDSTSNLDISSHHDNESIQLIQCEINSINDEIIQLKHDIQLQHNKSIKYSKINQHDNNPINSFTLYSSISKLYDIQNSSAKPRQQNVQPVNEEVQHQHRVAVDKLNAELANSENQLTDQRNQLQKSIEQLHLFNYTKHKIHDEINNAKHTLKQMISDHRSTIQYITQQYHTIQQKIHSGTNQYIASYIQHHRNNVRECVGLGNSNMESVTQLDNTIHEIIQQCNKYKSDNHELIQQIEAYQLQLNSDKKLQHDLALQSIQHRQQINQRIVNQPQPQQLTDSTHLQLTSGTAAAQSSPTQSSDISHVTIDQLQSRVNKQTIKLQQLQSKHKLLHHKIDSNIILQICIECYNTINDKIQYRYNVLYDRALVQYNYQLAQQNNDINNTSVLLPPMKHSNRVELYEWTHDDKQSYIQLLQSKLLYRIQHPTDSAPMKPSKPHRQLLAHNNKQLLHELSEQMNDMTFLTGMNIDDTRTGHRLNNITKTQIE